MVAGHDLDVLVVHGPVARPRLVPVAERVPAPVRLRVRHDGRDAGGRRVRVDPDIGPRVHRPRVGVAAGDPALLADGLRAELKGEAGERRAGLPVVHAVGTYLVPDEGFHLGRRPGLGQPRVVRGDVHDGRPQLGIARHAGGAVPADREFAERARLRRLLKREQVQWHAGRRSHRRGRPWDEVEPGYHAASTHGHKRRCLLPPWLPDGTHAYHFPPPGIAFAVSGTVRDFLPGCGRRPPCVPRGLPFALVTRRRQAGCSGSPGPARRPGWLRSGRERLPAGRSATGCRPSTAGRRRSPGPPRPRRR